MGGWSNRECVPKFMLSSCFRNMMPHKANDLDLYFGWSFLIQILIVSTCMVHTARQYHFGMFSDTKYDCFMSCGLLNSFRSFKCSFPDFCISYMNVLVLYSNINFRNYQNCVCGFTCIFYIHVDMSVVHRFLIQYIMEILK